MVKQHEMDNESIVNALQKVEPFSSLPKTVLMDLSTKIKQETFALDSFVFRQGEEPKKTLFIKV